MDYPTRFNKLVASNRELTGLAKSRLSLGDNLKTIIEGELSEELRTKVHYSQLSNDRTVLLAVASPSDATAIRFQVPQLERVINNSSLIGFNIKIRVKVSQISSKKKHAELETRNLKTPTISINAATTIRESAKTIENPRLRSSLAKLAETLTNQKQKNSS